MGITMSLSLEITHFIIIYIYHTFMFQFLWYFISYVP